MPTAIDQPINKLVELGQKLRHKRQEQALSLTEVATKTLIREHLLEAIEQGKLEQLPEPIYLHGLIKQYASVLSLEPEFLSSFTPNKLDSLARVRTDRKIVLPTVHLCSIHIYLLYLLVITCSVSVLYLDINQDQQLPNNSSELVELYTTVEGTQI